tara:strand:+ start:168 stop:545 length:378 start_codon:yes stop_codon:yes gene_type:complete
MNNKILGLVVVIVFATGAIAFALLSESASGSFAMFLSPPSFIFVVGVGGGLTYMRKHTFKDEELGKAIRSDFALAGWLGFLVGIILMGAGSDSIVNMPSAGLSAASITILYGYLAGAIVEAFMTN